MSIDSFLSITDPETALYSNGVKLIAGIDEVGRGPLAGPFVAAAVILNIEDVINERRVLSENRNNDVGSEKNQDLYTSIKDSKKLTSKKREEINKFLLDRVISYSIVEISSVELDEMGISQTTQTAFYKCVEGLEVKPEHILTDAFEIKKITKQDQTNLINGDNRSISIAAASIIAKVYRDTLMNREHDKYPEYGFKHNKGYGTKEHLEAIKKYGICPIHRRCFHPVSLYS